MESIVSCEGTPLANTWTATCLRPNSNTGWSCHRDLVWQGSAGSLKSFRAATRSFAAKTSYLLAEAGCASCLARNITSISVLT